MGLGWVAELDLSFEEEEPDLTLEEPEGRVLEELDLGAGALWARTLADLGLVGVDSLALVSRWTEHPA